MNRLVLVMICCCAPFALGFQGTKVGMIDADRIVQESNKGKAFLASLDEMSKNLKNDIQTKTGELQTLESDLKTKAVSLSENNLRELENKVTGLRTEIQRMNSDAERKMETALNDGLDVIRKEMIPIIRSVAIEKNLDLVLNLGPKSQVVYFHDRIDITDLVIEKYNETQK